MLFRPILHALIAGSALAAPARAQSPEGAAVAREELSFESGGIALAGTLLRPAGEGRRAAVVLVHGSGTSARDNPWTSAWADALAEAGLVVLYPDKRGSGASGGDWLEASFEDLADDAAAGIRLLRARPDVDPARVGAIGFSQGGYVVPLVALREPGCRCVAVVSGGLRPMLDQIVDELVLEAEAAGSPLSASDDGAVRDAYRRVLGAAQGREPWADAQRGADAARARSPAVAHALRTLPADPAHPAVGWVALVGDFDPLPHWTALERPALFVFGGKDTQIRVPSSLDLLASLPPGRRDVVLFGANGHALFRADAVALVARWFSDGGEG
jgi:pimeloyl-ACP methyl ester carboxylesterase